SDSRTQSRLTPTSNSSSGSASPAASRHTIETFSVIPRSIVPGQAASATPISAPRRWPSGKRESASSGTVSSNPSTTGSPASGSNGASSSDRQASTLEPRGSLQVAIAHDSARPSGSNTSGSSRTVSPGRANG